MKFWMIAQSLEHSMETSTAIAHMLSNILYSAKWNYQSTKKFVWTRPSRCLCFALDSRAIDCERSAGTLSILPLWRPFSFSGGYLEQVISCPAFGWSRNPEGGTAYSIYLRTLGQASCPLKNHKHKVRLEVANQAKTSNSKMRAVLLLK